MFIIFDILLLIGLALLVLWILALVKVIFAAAGPIIHVLLAAAVVFLALWFLARLCCGGRYSRKRSAAVV
ncbi:hypothetical protein HK097_004295 [Rhizophlyctis rosea]|uniref:Uncharacterized protein n=1 Tax=Rhizophlyctis rosea TaxID=64517 RepID=A0AAD5X055_9FUNG|nr:hypothetical protein HK097_004295 [Rhizophlyctis rosea]